VRVRPAGKDEQAELQDGKNEGAEEALEVRRMVPREGARILAGPLSGKAVLFGKQWLLHADTELISSVSVRVG
jgi:hypothetical protein